MSLACLAAPSSQPPDRLVGAVDSFAPAHSPVRASRLPDGVHARRVDSLAPARSAFRPARLPDGVPARRVLFVDFNHPPSVAAATYGVASE